MIEKGGRKESSCALIIISATPADVSMLLQLGVDGVFVGSGIFKSSEPEKRARAMVLATTHYNDPKILSEVSEDLGQAMVGIDINTTEKWADRESLPKTLAI